MLAIHIDGELVGYCESFQHRIIREPAHIYTLGQPDPRNFTRGRGKRYITLAIESNTISVSKLKLGNGISDLKLVEETRHYIKELHYKDVNFDSLSLTCITGIAGAVSMVDIIPKTNRYAAEFHLKDD